MLLEQMKVEGENYELWQLKSLEKQYLGTILI